MDALQDELGSTYPLLKITLLGVNLQGLESGNSQAVSGRDLGLLQDVDANHDSASDAWTLWNVAWRDLVILDAKNSKLSVFNLTEHNLATASEYATLRELLVDAAMAGQKPWMNPTQPNDVDSDGVVAPHDVLVSINSINRDSSRELPPPTGVALPALRYDTNGDGFLAPSDVLQIINYINLHGNHGEGESASRESGSADEATADALIAPTSRIGEQHTTAALCGANAIRPRDGASPAFLRNCHSD